ncbi:MAG: hypothetical protein NWE99_06030 [Candidatus Bathyarchaeota archaeon]|nr:hypothetical protein [Candidatus Bathyarchaeota archaeon]
MVEEKKKQSNKVKDLSFKVVRASVTAILMYVLYLLVAALLAPVFELVPWLAETIEAFIVVYIVLMILGDLTRGTIFQHFFNVARALFLIAYLLVSMGEGAVSMSYENFNLTINLTMFYAFAVVLSLLGLATTVMKAISYLNERAEVASGFHQP